MNSPLLRLVAVLVPLAFAATACGTPPPATPAGPAPVVVGATSSSAKEPVVPPPIPEVPLAERDGAEQVPPNEVFLSSKDEKVKVRRVHAFEYVVEAPNEQRGVAIEYAVLRELPCAHAAGATELNGAWKSEMQALVHEKEQSFDILVAHCNGEGEGNGRVHKFRFEITSFFGKM